MSQAGGMKTYLPYEIEANLSDFYMDILVENIEEHDDDGQFLDEAKAILELLRGLVLESQPPLVASEFSRTMSSVWAKPCFANAVKDTIEEHWHLVPSVLDCLKKCSAEERIVLMESDDCFQSSLKEMEPASATATDILSLFLAILIGYWTDEDLLLKLDQQMGEGHFGGRLDWMRRIESLAIASQKEYGRNIWEVI